jgi:hypothetical protein
MLEANLPLGVVGPLWFAMTLGSGCEVSGFHFSGRQVIEKKGEEKSQSFVTENRFPRFASCSPGRYWQE